MAGTSPAMTAKKQFDAQRNRDCAHPWFWGHRFELACMAQWVQSEISHVNRPVELRLFIVSALPG
jgi:hypothetical protein